MSFAMWKGAGRVLSFQLVGPHREGDGDHYSVAVPALSRRAPCREARARRVYLVYRLAHAQRRGGVFHKTTLRSQRRPAKPRKGSSGSGAGTLSL
jgi:hypothetical protein